MKRIAGFVFLLFIIGCQHKPIYVTPKVYNDPWNPVYIGAPNEHHGYTLYQAFTQLNTTNAASLDSLGNIYTEVQSRNNTRDSLNARMAAALNLGDYAYLQSLHGTAGNAMTYEDVVNYVASHGGGGGSGGFEGYIFIIGTTSGAPANGDTSYTFTDLAGDHIEVYRGTANDLSLQYLNTTPTNPKLIDGYRFNSSGTVVVKPAWTTGDRAIIKGYPSGSVNWLTLAGGGSTLLTGLRAGWELNEGSGTALADVLSTYNGTTTGTTGATGKLGYAESFVRASTQWADLGTTVGDVGTSDFSVAAWVYASTVSSENMGITGNCQDLGYFYLKVSTDDNKVHGVINFGGSNFDTESNSALSATTWTHVVYTCDRSGNAHLYINGVDQTDVTDISSGVAYSITGDNHYGIGSIGGYTTSYTWNGNIDNVFLWTKVLSGAEVTELYNSGSGKAYPF